MRSPIVYRYSGLDIELHLSADGCLIRYSRPKLVTDLRSDPYFRDALRKTELLYVLKYSRRPRYDRLTADIDGTEYIVFDRSKDTDLIYSMFAEKLHSKMNETWAAESVVKTVVTTAKSSYDRRFAALFALLMAKSKDYESERFIYLWMSMNALYGYMAEKHDAKLNAEWKQIKLIAEVFGFQYGQIDDAQKDKLRGTAMGVIEQMSPQESEDLSEKVVQKQKEWVLLPGLNKDVNQSCKRGRIDMAAFFLFWLPYQIRCKYFHGEKSMPVMCFAEERPLPVLRFINKTLMGFLDNELPKWFDQEALEKELLPGVHSITGDWIKR